MKYLKYIIFFLKNIFIKRGILLELAKRDFKRQYTSTFLGVLWLYIQPLMFIGVIYTVFSLGFRVSPADSNVPFSVWLISGMIAWQFFANNILAGSEIVKQYAFLVKKVDFSLSILPLVKLLSTYIPHAVFILLAIVITLYNGIRPSLYILQVAYYLIAMSLLLTGINWLTSSTNLFIPDVSKLVALLTQFGFWLTPIFWNHQNVPERFHWIINLNPMTYIVNGYRDSLIYQVGFWDKPVETIYFWAVCIFFCLVGAIVFKRLRPHFAEVV